jgi:hypothetical protein
MMLSAVFVDQMLLLLQMAQLLIQMRTACATERSQEWYCHEDKQSSTNTLTFMFWFWVSIVRFWLLLVRLLEQRRRWLLALVSVTPLLLSCCMGITSTHHLRLSHFYYSLVMLGRRFW